MRTLVNEYKSAGLYQINWDGRDERGNLLPTGLYFYKLNVGNQTLTRRMCLMK
jgi:flagellar hook assembly protein FlgD